MLEQHLNALSFSFTHTHIHFLTHNHAPVLIVPLGVGVDRDLWHFAAGVITELDRITHTLHYEHLRQMFYIIYRDIAQRTVNEQKRS